MTDKSVPAPSPNITEQRPRQNTGNHPDPLSEAFLITAAQLEELTTHAANASSAACHGSTTREKAAWRLFDAVAENVKAQPLVRPDAIQPGDTVECIDSWDTFNNLTVGQTYEVLETKTAGFVFVKGNHGQIGGWHPEKFKQVVKP